MNSLLLAIAVLAANCQDASVQAPLVASVKAGDLKAAVALLNGLFNQGAAEQFAAERRSITSLIGRPNQVAAAMANFEKRPPTFTDPA